MKRLIAIVAMIGLLLTSVCLAEGVPFSEWIAGKEPVVVEDISAEEAYAAEAPAFSPIGVGNRGDSVVQLQTKLIELGILNSKADGVFGPVTEAALKAAQRALGWEETGSIQTLDELNTVLTLVPGDGVNIASGTSSEWSEWKTPEYNAENRCFTVAYAYPDVRQVGELYTCQVEIEFADVTATVGSEGQTFRFFAQGAVDGAWDRGNVWNDNLVSLREAPANGVYKYESTARITEKNVDAVQFDLGFRCDYWASGSFRVRCVKVEKGIATTDWTLSPRDIGDGVNIASGTSSEWSEWKTPEYNAENRCFTVAYAYPDVRQVGELYTCQVEIEFADVTATVGSEGQAFWFRAQGAVDGAWDRGNVWNDNLVSLREAPANGVYKYESTARITEKNVDAVQFDLGFRCDYWASGSFRVRCVKVEKGISPTDWSPSEVSIGDEE